MPGYDASNIDTKGVDMKLKQNNTKVKSQLFPSRLCVRLRVVVVGISSMTNFFLGGKNNFWIASNPLCFRNTNQKGGKKGKKGVVAILYDTFLNGCHKSSVVMGSTRLEVKVLLI